MNSTFTMKMKPTMFSPPPRGIAISRRITCSPKAAGTHGVHADENVDAHVNPKHDVDVHDVVRLQVDQV